MVITEINFLTRKSKKLISLNGYMGQHLQENNFILTVTNKKPRF